ncbi:MAG: hypothetical protein HYZ47_01015 [Simkania negevensis]|nr:hypothetical protein [Simkania negevensis]
MALKEPERDSSSPNGKLSSPSSHSLISTIWTLLESLCAVDLFTLPTEKKGKGVVLPYKEGDNQLILQETGRWEGEVSIPYYNSFRFTKYSDFLSLEHLRFGKNHPVFLFDLVPQTEKGCISRSPHLCGEDLYHGGLETQEKGLLLMFDLKGPEIEERIYFTYSG